MFGFTLAGTFRPPRQGRPSHEGKTARTRYVIPPAKIAPGRYRRVSGNEAMALGLITAARRAGDFEPYRRDERLVRQWALPGTPGLEHRIGGLEKRDGSGEVCYDPENHELMVRMREEKIARIADAIPSAVVGLSLQVFSTLIPTRNGEASPTCNSSKRNRAG